MFPRVSLCVCVSLYICVSNSVYAKTHCSLVTLDDPLSHLFVAEA